MPAAPQTAETASNMSTPLVLIIESTNSGLCTLFVEAIQALGAQPILLAADPSAYSEPPGLGLECIVVDTSSRRELLEASIGLRRRGPLSGVLCYSDYFVWSASWLACKLGLPGPQECAVRACRNKWTQRLRLQRAGVPMPRFKSAKSPAEAVHLASALTYPVVVKPLRGSGSIGVRLCRSSAEVAEWSAALLETGRDGRGRRLPYRVLIEENIEGAEYSIEIFNGVVIGITAKHLGQEPYFLEVGHDFPAPVRQEEASALTETALRAVAALGLALGPAHVEIRSSGAGPRLIEVNPRLAGGMIPEIVRIATGVDLVTQTVRLAMSETVCVEPKYRRHASIRFVIPAESGRLLGIENVASVRQMAGVRDVTLRIKAGSEIRLRGDWRDRIGWVITAGASGEESRKAAISALARLELRMMAVDGARVSSADMQGGASITQPAGGQA